MEKRLTMIDVAVVAAVLLFLVCCLPKILKPEVKMKRSKVPVRQQQSSEAEQEEGQIVYDPDELVEIPTDVNELEDFKTAPVHETEGQEDIKTATVDPFRPGPPTTEDKKQKQPEDLQSTDSNAFRNFGDDVVNQQSQPRFGGGEVRVSCVPPEGIFTEPKEKIVFNAPFDMQHFYHIRVVNTGSHRIAWATKTNNPARLGTVPHCGVLDAAEEIKMAVHCNAFDPVAEVLIDDRISLVWTNTPDDSPKEFRFEWFQGNGLLRRKNLPIVYNV